MEKSYLGEHILRKNCGNSFGLGLETMMKKNLCEVIYEIYLLRNIFALLLSGFGL